MIFPDSPRVIYSQNPLEEVICQLRFPAILRVDTEIPAAFQDKIRNDYPLFTERQSPEEGLGIPPEVLKALGQDLPIHTGKQGYEFASDDQVWKVVLTRDFLALTTTKYERWEQFRGHLMLPLGALIEQYSPAFYSRIGLRYRDVIKKSKLDLKEVQWSELLNSYVAGELSSPIASAIKKVSRGVNIELPNGMGQVRIRHGLMSPNESGEQYYVIDADFYTDQRTEVSDAIERLGHFNREAGRLFRWCITERLHAAMGPQAIQS